MNKDINSFIEKLLSNYKTDKISEKEALKELKDFYFEDIGFAKIDHHRSLRRDFPEVIYGQNKTPQQILEIAKSILKHSGMLMITRTNLEVYDLIKKEIPDVLFNEKAGIVYIPPFKEEKDLKPGITVVCAGTADIPIAEEAATTAYLMGNKVKKIFDAGIAGMHRLISQKDVLLASNVIIAVAGMEGALPSIISSMVDCIVVGVPTSVGYGASFGGLSQLLTMLNSCSPGIVVVNIDNGFGAGYSAGLINKNL
jgi:NCAIR mutase (PurE)-related protein